MRPTVTHYARDVRKIYASKELSAEYNALETEIRSLDVGIPIPPPVHVSAIDELRRILARLKGADHE